jgi:hypothetical protein
MDIFYCPNQSRETRLSKRVEEKEEGCNKNYSIGPLGGAGNEFQV